ncbi:TPA: restriction endonuclease subunit S [Pseudomonas aeruginosa]|uniref:Restriction endonuclease subunit S n=1 Tax=Pseudomonas extremaustralis TaxID=359110 RepID=A0A5C5QLD1_9PSED|nr:restriction endonuclease subunit S [Pseudomonas extremaustralis]EZI29242.1 restriction endonuclease [Pseudomonas extremaustralis 14-3 substr. 14-3b]TWS06300.1 restriction endonuclease subunit S [Pseudomonas extremaustralis]SDF54501.1 type I restriction enzyme, S subunit [Pseudomonas extremaustralis]
MSGNDKRPLVPLLRFSEFRNARGWSFQPLRTLAERSTRKNTDCELTRVLTNSAEYGVVDQRDFFDKDIANQGKLEGYYIVEKGAYVYNPRISATAPVGPISNNRIGTGLMSPLYTVFKFNNSRNDFYAHYFKSTHWYQYMRQSSSTGARHDRMSIANDDFMGLPLPVSSPEEQQKIADCLSSLDELITAETQKLNGLKMHKMSLMQQLFPREGETVPRLRFPEFRDAGEWKEVAFSTQVELISGLHLAPDEYSDTGEVPYFTGPSDYANDLSLVGKWAVRSTNTGCAGDILITVKGSGVGELLYLELEEVAMGRQLMAVRPRSAHGGFVFHFLATQRQRLVALASGNLIPGLSRGDILGLTMSVPERDEQQAIAECLSSLDNLAAAQSLKIDALKTHKKGLMQQLFPVLDAVQA